MGFRIKLNSSNGPFGQELDALDELTYQHNPIKLERLQCEREKGISRLSRKPDYLLHLPHMHQANAQITSPKKRRQLFSIQDLRLPFPQHRHIRTLDLQPLPTITRYPVPPRPRDFCLPSANSTRHERGHPVFPIGMTVLLTGEDSRQHAYRRNGNGPRT